ncbi:hypothetical protein [Hyphomicrobium sp.]|uniref:hypothetical protein n=1 Tax=Hyphomicrobium sp. TaxID=82 RepID=UPI002E33A0E4|nr:hypothetical protein [Hyphomicrobium sp.]HEX2841167.1 hypothetical protein [Hyphomicrobium sp.]
MASLLDINDVVASRARLKVRRIGPADLRIVLAKRIRTFLTFLKLSWSLPIGVAVVSVEPRCA